MDENKIETNVLCSIELNLAFKCINVAGGQKGNGINCHLWDNPDSDDSQFTFERVNNDKTDENDIYIIKSKANGGYLYANENGNIEMYDDPNSPNSQWIVKEIIDDDYKQDEKNISSVYSMKNVKIGQYISYKQSEELTDNVSNGTNIELSNKPIASKWKICFIDESKKLRMKYEVYLLYVGDINSTAEQTFKARLECWTHRALSNGELKEYEQLNDKSEFSPSSSVLVYPLGCAAIEERENMEFRNGKDFIIDYDEDFKRYKTVCCVFINGIFLEPLELKGFPFDVQHFQIG
eukprot:237719_1